MKPGASQAIRSGRASGLSGDAQAWRRAWRRAKRHSPVNLRERHAPLAEISHWNRRASSYAEHADSEPSRAHRETILAWLEASGVFTPGCRILDIGAGPGHYAAALARRASEVLAVEPAEGMCAALHRCIHAQGLPNIRVVQKTWEQVDIAAEGWQGACDLVFASMSPGVNSPEALEKMLACSRAWCYLSGWSGPLWGRWALAQAELWPLVFDEPLGDYPSDVLYPFGLLYALGHRPSLRFERPRVRLQLPCSEATAGLAEHFQRYVQLDARIRGIIEDYVSAHSADGVFRQDYHTCQGFLLWRV